MLDFYLANPDYLFLALLTVPIFFYTVRLVIMGVRRQGFDLYDTSRRWGNWGNFLIFALSGVIAYGLRGAKPTEIGSDDVIFGPILNGGYLVADYAVMIVLLLLHAPTNIVAWVTDPESYGGVGLFNNGYDLAILVVMAAVVLGRALHRVYQVVRPGADQGSRQKAGSIARISFMPLLLLLGPLSIVVGLNVLWMAFWVTIFVFFPIFVVLTLINSGARIRFFAMR